MACVVGSGDGTTVGLTDFWSTGNRSLLPFTNPSRAGSAEFGATMTVRRALSERAQDVSKTLEAGAPRNREAEEASSGAAQAGEKG
mgnify:CR=1 FL=1